MDFIIALFTICLYLIPGMIAASLIYYICYKISKGKKSFFQWFKDL